MEHDLEYNQKTSAMRWVGIVLHHCVIHPIVIPAGILLRDMGYSKLARLAGLSHDLVCILTGECDGTI